MGKGVGPMTAVGKILVFFNLIFSLIVGAFVVTVYISQTHWAAEYNNLKKRYEVADASNAAYQQELKKASDYAKSFNDQVLRDGDLEKAAGLKESDDQATKLKKIKDVIKAALADSAVQKGLADKARDDLRAATEKLTATNAVLVAKDAEVAKRQEESKQTRALLAEETDKNLKAVVAVNKAHDEAVAESILAKSAQARLQQLEAENDQLARDNQKLVAGGGDHIPDAQTERSESAGRERAGTYSSGRLKRVGSHFAGKRCGPCQGKHAGSLPLEYADAGVVQIPGSNQNYRGDGQGRGGRAGWQDDGAASSGRSSEQSDSRRLMRRAVLILITQEFRGGRNHARREYQRPRQPSEAALRRLYGPFAAVAAGAGRRRGVFVSRLQPLSFQRPAAGADVVRGRRSYRARAGRTGSCGA